MAYLVLLLGLGFWAALTSKPFEPTPSLAPARRLVIGLTIVASGILLLSLTQVWWIFEDPEHPPPDMIRRDSPEVILIVGFALLANLAAVLAVRGRRNWVPLALVLPWLLIAWGWIESDGLGDSTGEVRPGLRLGTLAILLTTVAAIVGAMNRSREHRQRVPSRPGG